MVRNIKADNNDSTKNSQVNKDEVSKLSNTSLTKYNDAIIAIEDSEKTYEDFLQDYFKDMSMKSDKYILIVIAFAIIIIVSMNTIIGLTINNLLKSLKLFRTSMEKVSDGDITVNIEMIGKGEFANLSKSFNTMINKINHLISETLTVVNIISDYSNSLQSLAATTEDSAKDVEKSVQVVAVGAAEQAEDAEIVNLKIDELNSKIESVYQKFDDVLGVSKNTLTVSNGASKQIKELDDISKKISIFMDKTKNDFYNLKNSTEEIINIVTVIKTISQQTNLQLQQIPYPLHLL